MNKEALRITIKVKPGSKKSAVTIENGILVVAVTSRPTEGKANTHAIELLSKTFGISKTCFTIISGHHYKMKCVEIQTNARDIIQNCLKKLEAQT